MSMQDTPFLNSGVVSRHFAIMATMQGFKQIFLGTIAMVAATFRPDCWAFSRDYNDYEVASANGEYFAKVQFEAEGSPKFGIYRKDTAAGEDAKLWETKLWVPIGERVLVSDDGHSAVLEDNYPYALRGLYFYLKIYIQNQIIENGIILRVFNI